MYKILHLLTAEEVTKPLNRHGREMTVRQARRYLRSDNSIVLMIEATGETYFTTEPEFRDNHVLFNRGFREHLGRVKVPKHLISIMRIPNV